MELIFWKLQLFKAYGAGCRCSPSEPQKAPFSLSTLHLPRYNSPSP